VLLFCEEEGTIERAIMKNKEWFDGVFDSLVPWNDSFVVPEKFVWVWCRGISLSLWSNQYFERIGALVGTLVEVDEVTITREVLEYARLRIRILVGEEARSVKSVRINDTLCQVSFEEEICFLDHLRESFLKECHTGNEDDSEACSDASLGEEGFFRIRVLGLWSRFGEKGGEEQTFQFPEEEGEIPNGGTCIIEKINSVVNN